MIKVIHDITHRMFRDPAGAMQAGSPVLLTLLISGEPPESKLYLKIQSDKGGQIRTVPMHETVSPDPSFNAWTASYTPSGLGLLWYWFELRTEASPAWSEGADNGEAEEGSEPLLIGCDSQTHQAAILDSPHAWQLTVYDPAYPDPDWIRGGVFYHIFVDRFAKAGPPVRMGGKITRSDWGGEPVWEPDPNGEILNNDFFGGNFAGIREKLPYLADLGVTCLYLSPIFEAYSSHKYDTSDYLKVDPMFGDEAGFTSLCEEAKARGMRVICDGVFSHTGSDSRYFDIYDRYGDGALHHPDSPYRDWYYFEHDTWQSWWGIKTLPRVNKEIPSYQKFITGKDGVIRHWRRAGASGWRLDVVDELPKAFLEKLTAAAKAEKNDALILGEVWEDASNKIAYEERKDYFEGDKLESVMNYPLRRGIINYVREGNAFGLAETMAIILAHYPMRVVHALMNILGTHDTDRIITALAGQKLGPDAGREEKAAVRMDADEWAAGIRRLKIAVVLQMTLPGVPCIYYGDEAGMEGYNDPFNRRCYPWGHENKEIQDWYRRVIRIRRESDLYVDGDYRAIAAHDGLYAFERTKESADGSGSSHSSGGSRSIGGLRRQITVTNCSPQHQVLPLFGLWRDLLSGVTVCDEAIVMPGQAMILAPV